MKRFSTFGFLILVAFATAFAQVEPEKKPDTRRVEPIGSTAVPKPVNVEIPKLTLVETKIFDNEASGILEGTSSCDANGAVYLRSPTSLSNGRGIIVRLNPNDSKSQRFDLSELPGAQGGAFAIGQDGEVYFMADQFVEGHRPATFRVTFSKEGSVKSKVKLDEFGTIHFAAFSSGDFLIAGRRAKKKVDGKNMGSEDFTAIMDSSGKLVKYLELPDDETIRKGIAAGDSSFTNTALPQGSNRAVDLGSALTGPDGLVYVLRSMAPTIIYALDSTGQVVKRLEIAAPQGMMPWEFQIAEGRIAIRFQKTGSHSGSDGLLKTVDWQTGQEISSFRLADDVTGTFSCYSLPDRFAFLGNEGSKLALKIVEYR
jgi:hypothetical protein